MRTQVLDQILHGCGEDQVLCLDPGSHTLDGLSVVQEDGAVVDVALAQFRIALVVFGVGVRTTHDVDPVGGTAINGDVYAQDVVGELVDDGTVPEEAVEDLLPARTDLNANGLVESLALISGIDVGGGLASSRIYSSDVGAADEHVLHAGLGRAEGGVVTADQTGADAGEVDDVRLVCRAALTQTRAALEHGLQRGGRAVPGRVLHVSDGHLAQVGLALEHGGQVDAGLGCG